MFNQISMWQMVVDLCLVTSILVMAFRMVKSSRVHALLPQVTELETRVMKLITEAEHAAKTVHDQLLRREQNLTRYIAELESKERGVSDSIEESESLAKELSLMCESARREVEELSTALSRTAQRRIDSQTYEEDRRDEYRRNQRPDRARGADLDERDSAAFSTRSSSRRASEWLERSPASDREEVAKAATEPSAVQKLHALYLTAEDMLKSGRKPQEVSERTKLPVEGVERLAQMIEIEREEAQEKEKVSIARAGRDSRLGVLGVSRRPSSSL